MQSKYYGQVSLTKLLAIAKAQPELVKEVTFRDGHKEKMLNISILTNDQPDQYGKIGAVRVDCQRDKQRQDLNYWAGDLKESKFNQPPAPQQPQQSFDQPLSSIGEDDSNDDLPF